MNTFISLVLAGCASWAVEAQAAELVKARDGSGTYGYKDTPVLPWCGFHVHDPDRPVPPRVDPGPALEPPAPAPADAIVLFNGRDVSEWEPSDWIVKDGLIEAVGSSNLTTKRKFGSCQIHLEWMAPDPPRGPWYNRGNNGVYLMDRYEIQIFDSHTEKIYPDGQAAAIYGQTPPLVDAMRPPGQWQVFDILFSAPVWNGDKLAEPARVTMLHNGVLVHLNEPIRGQTAHRVLPVQRSAATEGPLRLGGHDNPVRFRNIWIRPLDRPGREGQAGQSN